MAICRIGGNPGTTFGQTQVSTTDAAPPDMLCIIGHPAGQPKRIEAGPTTSIIGSQIHYNDVDTLGGNSGSGILRASDGRLVGIHTNGGCNPQGTGTNFGQRIAAVIAVSPTLQAMTRPKRKIGDDPVKPVLDNPVTLKFRDDLAKPILDNPVTLKFRDDIVKPVLDNPVSMKFRDDIKLPLLDKRPGSDRGIFGGQPRPFGPEAQGTRPFILSTPHHSAYWGAGNQQAEALAQLENALAQIEQAMAAGEAELAQLDAEYRQLLAEYHAAGGGQTGGG